MSQRDEERDEREHEGDAQGVPAAETLDAGVEPTGVVGKQHWRESTITQPGLDDRGDVFFAAIEMTRMPMIITDPAQSDNPVVFANKAFLDLTGYEEGEVLGRNCRFLQGAQTDRQTVAEIRDAVAKRQSIAIEVLNYRRDGSAFWNAVFIGPVYDTSGTLLYFFASQLDVTRRRESERAHHQAQKMEAIGQLTAGLAHDFNNLLQVVTGNLELLAARIDDERGERYVARARAAADRGAKLTRQLLAFARKSRLETQALDLTELVTGFGEVMESSLGSGIDLHLSLRRKLPPAVIDPGQFEMALLNVLINARDAMPQGGTVTVATAALRIEAGDTARTLPAGDYVSIEVRDEGEGMTAAVLDRAIEPFFTTKGVGKGTGLGLAMASGYLQQSRGRLEISSTVGVGTTVRMIFPVAREEPEQRPTTAASRRESGSSMAAHILVVEDDPDVLALATEMLVGAGYAVTGAGDAAAGLRAYESATAEHPIDLLFTDLVMPGAMNGIALAAEIARRDPALPVLMTTGYNEELVSEAPRQPDADVIGKPYRRAELLDRIRQAIERRSTGARRKPSEYGAVEA